MLSERSNVDDIAPIIVRYWPDRAVIGMARDLAGYRGRLQDLPRPARKRRIDRGDAKVSDGEVMEGVVTMRGMGCTY